jgi:D-alanyl-lipoteichoic acid acyltransferase DltB (MBOAT superfamily)
VLVSAKYLALRRWGERSGWLPWLAFLMPIGILVAIRYAPFTEMVRLFGASLGNTELQRHPEFTLSSVFIGSSYLAFRTSHLALEVRNGVVPRPGFWEYFGFAFFAPTLSVGPINPYSQHRRAFAETDRPEIPVGHALLRVIVGAVKCKFFGPLLNQLTYEGLLLDGHPHLWVDLPIAAVAYYLYLYCNFSGFCDIAIGGAGLMGVAVAENFANPFAARNLKDFWNRWHITLSQYMRDMVFSPLSKALVRAFGAAQANHGIALAILVVFLLVGVWHGVGWNYAAFGAAHALGVTTNHYFDIALKKWLGKERFAAYNRSPAIHAAAVALTFLYVTASLFLFANDWDTMKNILSVLRMH